MGVDLAVLAVAAGRWRRVSGARSADSGADAVPACQRTYLVAVPAATSGVAQGAVARLAYRAQRPVGGHDAQLPAMPACATRRWRALPTGPFLPAPAHAFALPSADSAAGVLGGAPVAAIAAGGVLVGGTRSERGDFAALPALALGPVLLVALRAPGAVVGHQLDPVPSAAAGALPLRTGPAAFAQGGVVFAPGGGGPDAAALPAGLSDLWIMAVTAVADAAFGTPRGDQGLPSAACTGLRCPSRFASAAHPSALPVEEEPIGQGPAGSAARDGNLVSGIMQDFRNPVVSKREGASRIGECARPQLPVGVQLAGRTPGPGSGVARGVLSLVFPDPRKRPLKARDQAAPDVVPTPLLRDVTRTCSAVVDGHDCPGRRITVCRTGGGAAVSPAALGICRSTTCTSIRSFGVQSRMSHSAASVSIDSRCGACVTNR